MSNSYPPPPGQQPPPQWGQQPPQQPWGQQPPPGWGQPPQKKTPIGWIVAGAIGGVFLLLIVLGLAVGGGADGKADAKKSATPTADVKGDQPPTKDKREPPAKEEVGEPADDDPKGDVRITGCVVEPTTTWPAADLTITNRSSKTSNYIISVEFVDASGTRLGEGTAAANNVAPGQKVKEKAQSLDDTSGKINCKVLKATRYASGS
ncbi:hypothetical protein J7I98_31570 [Streptomyces sp. ISL-98]|uniref:FxLYD domain-containing protein n=1 Tax=Streptomyces sp. ISL-98 TaxID=2819192 RepID=UPI001BE59B5B|nr:FxLYD domain-containing protein [Streptomyces sp. ISL-98]MBT2510316.1 hypothetical protein [Streptomyces sp. ISL-98]